MILSAVRDNENAIGYLGFAYFVENEGAVKAVELARTTQYVAPSFENVGSYPMARPLHIYTNGKPTLSDKRTSAIHAYIEFVLSEEGQELVPFVGFVKLDLVNATLRSDQLRSLGG